MAVYTADAISAQNPPVGPHSAGEMYVQRSRILVTDLAINTVIKMHVVPPGCIPVDVMVECQDLDSGAGLTWDMGLLNAAGTDLTASTEIINGSTVGQVAGVQRANHYNLGNNFTVNRAADQYLAIKATAGVVGLNAGKYIRSTLMYRASEYGL